jgi:hypothetical protein
MDETDYSITGKAKEYLTRKLDELEKKVANLSKKRKLIKILYYLSITLSITLTGVITMLAGFAELPLYVIPILSTSSGILTGLSAKFNFEDKSFQYTREIDKLNKLKSKLDYVVHCNGKLTEQEYQQILSEF